MTSTPGLPQNRNLPDTRAAGELPTGPNELTGWVIAPTPVAVWLSGPLRSCPRDGHQPAFGEPPCAWRWPGQLWDSILTSYSRPGDLVLLADAADGRPLFHALDQGRRVHARIPSRSPRVAARRELRAGRGILDPREATVFSDRQPTGDRPHRKQGDSAARTSRGWPDRALRGQVDLMVLPPACPADQAVTPSSPEAADRWQHGVLAERCRLLRPGGVIAVLTRVTPDRAGAVERIRPLMAQAHALGLTYLQHNPVVHANVRASRLEPAYGWDDQTFAADVTDPTQYRVRPRLLDHHPDSSHGAGPVDVPRLHMPVHSDLIVFTRPRHPGGQP
jgi:hypothetical protein